MKEKQQAKPNFVTLEQLKAKLYNTPEKRAKYEAFYREERTRLREEYLKEIAEEVRKARTVAGLTQAQLAGRLHTDRTVVARLESAGQNLTVEYMARIAKALDKKLSVTIC